MPERLAPVFRDREELATLNTECAALTELGDFALAEPLLLGSLAGLEG